jgi:hypothetical protein
LKIIWKFKPGPRPTCQRPKYVNDYTPRSPRACTWPRSHRPWSPHTLRAPDVVDRRSAPTTLFDHSTCTAKSSPLSPHAGAGQAAHTSHSLQHSSAHRAILCNCAAVIASCLRRRRLGSNESVTSSSPQRRCCRARGSSPGSLHHAPLGFFLLHGCLPIVGRLQRWNRLTSTSVSTTSMT